MDSKGIKSASGKPQVSCVAEYVKIRQYVVNQILGAGRERKLIPSNRELERIFGVSRPTVQRALGDLVSDGYLIAKPGIGTFTNPDVGLGNYGDYKRIGLIVGDGLMSIYDRFTWNLATWTGERLLRKSHKYCLQPLSLVNSGERLFDEIADLDISGLIWAGPGPEQAPVVRRVKEELAMPLVCVGASVEGVSSYFLDFEQASYEAAKSLLAEGRKSFLFVYYKWHSMGIGLDGVRRACSEAGVSFDSRQAIAAGKDTLEDIGSAFDMGLAPQGIIAWALGPQLIDLLASKNVDFRDSCRLVTNNWTLALPAFRDGISLCVHDFDFMAERAAERLAALCEGRSLDVESVSPPFKYMSAEEALKLCGGLI